LPTRILNEFNAAEADDEKARQDREGIGNRYGSIEYEWPELRRLVSPLSGGCEADLYDLLGGA
jgi:hypothetical protein